MPHAITVLNLPFPLVRFDTELQLLQDELRQERSQKERAMRERDAAITDKLTTEQSLQVFCFTFQSRPCSCVKVIPTHRNRTTSFFVANISFFPSQ